MALLSKIIGTVAKRRSPEQPKTNGTPAKTMHEMLAEEGVVLRGIVKPSQPEQPIKIPGDLISGAHQPKPAQKLDYQSMSLNDMFERMRDGSDKPPQVLLGGRAEKHIDAIGKCPWDTIGKNHSAVPAAHSSGQEAIINAILNNGQGIGAPLALMDGIKHGDTSHAHGNRRRF